MATLLLYGALLRYAIAVPTPPSSVSISSVDASPSVYATPSDAPTFDTNYRSTAEVVWSCLTVIIASSWLCVHPNVTGHSTTMWQRLRERLILFAITLFAPEVMAVFAYDQWRGSKKLYERFKKRAEGLGIPLLLTSGVWTRGIGTPADTNAQDGDAPGGSNPTSVGGSSTLDESRKAFNSADNGETGRQWAFRRFCMGMWSPVKTIPVAITSFGTDPKKATWSYTHAHFVQMGGITFRDKNDDVRYKGPKKWTNEDLTSFFALKLTEAAVSDKSKAGALAKILVIVRVLWFLIQAIARKAQGLPIALLEVASLAFIVFNFAMYIFWWNKPLDVEYPLEVTGVPGGKRTVPTQYGSGMAGTMLVGLSEAFALSLWTYSPKRQWYPRLYSFGKESGVRDDDGDYATLVLTIAVTSSCFGAFHTIGWYLPAPTQVERTLWRVSCLVLTLYPFLLLVMLMLVHSLSKYVTPRTRFQNGLDALITTVFLLLGIPCGIAYIGARLTIMFLPFFELRELPSLIHRTVSWSRFLSPI